MSTFKQFIARALPDRLYLKVMYHRKINRKLNLDTPNSFNEKLQWLKLYDRNPAYINMVDKYEVRKYISDKIGDEYLIPLIGVYDKFEDINFNDLPNQFVIKCTHDSGGVILCRDKENFNVGDAEKRIVRNLNENYFYFGREWPYKMVKPRIIIEKYMVDESGTQLKDYKFFCFNGEPKALYVASDRGIDTRFDFFDLDFNLLPFSQCYKNSGKKINKPPGFDIMISLARKLSEGIPHVRVDFYDINGKIYFGELTFYHLSGFEKFEPEEYDNIFGSWLELPKGIKKI